MSEQTQASADAGMDPNGLFREETFTDRRIGTIHVLTPVLPNGEDDASRSKVFLGETQMRTAAGPLPISFEIEAGNIGEAAEKFAEAAREGAERTIRQIEEMQREAANKIVVPGSPEMDSLTGGMPGGGKIHIP
ncbi:MAG: hypothetical protein R3E62_08785 [Pseudomonadales bacterium]|jgi:hypothetical protein